MSSKHAHTNDPKYTLLGLPVILLWSLSVTWARALANDLGMLVACATVQLGLAVTGVLVWSALGKQAIIRAALSSRWFYLRGALFVLNILSFYGAVSLVTRVHLPVVIFLNYLWPTLLMLASAWILKLPIYRKTLFAFGCLITLASIGYELLHSTASEALLDISATDFLAYLLALGAAVTWALYSVVSRGWGALSGGHYVTPLYSLVVALLVYGLAATLQTQQPHFTSTALTWLAIAISANFIGYVLWDLGTRKGSIVTLSLAADTIPWLSLAWAFCLLDVPVSATTIVSALTLVFGALMARAGTLELGKARGSATGRAS